MKTAFLFPGQGAQYVGMAKDFCAQFESSRQVFTMACDVTGLDLRHICFEENDQLDQTEYTQAALLTAELAILAAVRETGLQPVVTAGQSLGEYAALVASGYLDAADAIRTVRQRGILMQNAVPLGQGAMVAVVGLKADQIEVLCQEADGDVQISNYNTEKQSVVSGERSAVMRVKQLAENAGARLAVELSVSVPSHSQLMRGAAQELERVLRDVTVCTPKIPYVANATAAYVRDAAQVKPLLVSQLYSAVRWEQSISAMRDAGVNCFVEIGPGDTLTKMNKKIDRTMKSINVERVEDLDKIREIMC